MGNAAEGWPELDEHALHGLAGDVVETVAPHTEADPVALLVTYLTMVGNAIGRGPHAIAEAAPHPGRLFSVIVGQSSKSRKGSSRAQMERIVKGAEQRWRRDCQASGIVSGEALVERAEKAGGRLFVTEGEFAHVLSVAGREGSTLSMLLRDAWDGRVLRVIRAHKTVEAAQHHISVLGHITIDELRSRLPDIEVANGFANRFLFFAVKRARLLPHGGDLSDEDVNNLVMRTRHALQEARKVERVRRTEAADERWADLYTAMANDDPGGLTGAMTARAEAQTLRLSVLYALLDGQRYIDVPHLEAGYAVWLYARDTVHHIFGRATGDPVLDRIVAALRQGPKTEMTKSEIYRHFSNHLTAGELHRAIEKGQELGKLAKVDQDTGGRQREVIILAEVNGHAGELYGSEDEDAADHERDRLDELEEVHAPWHGGIPSA